MNLFCLYQKKNIRNSADSQGDHQADQRGKIGTAQRKCSKPQSAAYQKENYRKEDPGCRIKSERHFSVDKGIVQKSNYQLTDQKSPEISLYPHLRNGEYYKENPNG